MRAALRRAGWALALVACAWLPAAAPAPPLLLAGVLGPEADPADFLVSEKYDGVRALWDGRTLRFRSGRRVSAPRWFLDRLPAQALDGELWLGRGRFEELCGFVRRAEAVDAEWRQITYMVFELPDAPGHFAVRARRMQELAAAAAWPQLVAVPQFRVADRAELQRRLDQVIKDGGEGLMLHRADAPYLTGRTDALLKLKPLQDTEAVVVAQIPGTGRFRGMLGALRVETPEGRTFLLGTGFSDSVRRHPPPVGTTITYTYRGLTRNGVPRHASYLRIRETF